ncbi:MAG: hypothetical protein Q9162_000118 [Coniocarpon cinnabarinum]
MASPQAKPILVTGATGKQGGAVIDALLASPRASNFTILGVTRDPNSAGAQKLAAKSPLIKVVKGDYADLPALFRSATAVGGQPVWGVFSVQTAEKPALEEKQGKGLIDEALANNVEHFVYTSVDRGGNEKSWENPTDVPHFQSKHNIEQYLKTKAVGSAMSWSVLRPVAFMDNFAPGFQTKVLMSAWKQSIGLDTPVQLVSTSDIGHYAVQSFLDPSRYSGQAIGIAGDDLSQRQIQESLRKIKGYELPPTFSIVGKALLYMVNDVNKMLNCE